MVDRPGLLQAAQGARPLDAAAVGEQGGGSRHRRARERLHDWTHGQKNRLKPHYRQRWVIPPKANSAFVAALEDVLAVYMRPRDPDRPLGCLDETSKQLIPKTRVPIPLKPGRRPVSIASTSPTAPPTQPVHAVRAARRLAPHQGDGLPHRHRLSPRLEGFG